MTKATNGRPPMGTVPRATRRPFRINAGYWFVLPAMLFFVALAIYPAGYVAYLSLFATGKGMTPQPIFTAFSNYTSVWHDAAFARVAVQTVRYAAGASLMHLFFGLIIALLLNTLPLNQTFIRGARTAFLIPWAISPTVVAMVSRLLMHPQISPIAIGLRNLGSNTVFGPLGNPSQALLAVTATNAWNFMPFYMLMLLSAMQAIDPGLYEAAIVDGASGRQQIRYITLPAIRNQLLILGIFDFVTTAAYFDMTWIMTQGGPVFSTEILATWAYRTAFLGFEFGKASAIGMLLFFLSIIVSVVVLTALDKE